VCFGGLPRFFAGNGLCMSAALRNKPARFRASVFSLPAGIKRAASSVPSLTNDSQIGANLRVCADEEN